MYKAYIINLLSSSKDAQQTHFQSFGWEKDQEGRFDTFGSQTDPAPQASTNKGFHNRRQRFLLEGKSEYSGFEVQFLGKQIPMLVGFQP